MRLVSFEEMTREEFDLLSVKEENTYYLVKEDGVPVKYSLYFGEHPVVINGGIIPDAVIDSLPYDSLEKLLPQDEMYVLSDETPKKIQASRLLSAFNQYFGKHIIFNGDSITAGSGTSGGEQNRWANKLAEFFEADFDNYAISGSTIAVREAEPTTRNPIVTRFDDMDDGDLVIIFAGTNDYQYNWTPIGVESDTSIYTFYGAMNTLCQGLLDKYPAKQILFLTPIKRAQSPYDTQDAPNDLGYTLKQYCEIIIKVCSKYGIPVINMNDTVTINPLIEDQKTLLIPDGTHPNNLGNELIYQRVKNVLLGGFSNQYNESLIILPDGFNISTLKAGKYIVKNPNGNTANNQDFLGTGFSPTSPESLAYIEVVDHSTFSFLEVTFFDGEFSANKFLTKRNSDGTLGRWQLISGRTPELVIHDNLDFNTVFSNYTGKVRVNGNIVNGPPITEISGDNYFYYEGYRHSNSNFAYQKVISLFDKDGIYERYRVATVWSQWYKTLRNIYGTTAQRPAINIIGDIYWDTDLERIIWNNGTGWIDIFGTKQDALVSGTNIKTVGGQSLLGSGDIPINISLTETLIDTLDDNDTINLSAMSAYDKIILELYVDESTGSGTTPYEYIVKELYPSRFVRRAFNAPTAWESSVEGGTYARDVSDGSITSTENLITYLNSNFPANAQQVGDKARGQDGITFPLEYYYAIVTGTNVYKYPVISFVDGGNFIGISSTQARFNAPTTSQVVYKLRVIGVNYEDE